VDIKEGGTWNFRASLTNYQPASLLKALRDNLIQETLTGLLLRGHSCGLDLLGEKLKLQG
jgi:hypothetical protein